MKLMARHMLLSADLMPELIPARVLRWHTVVVSMQKAFGAGIQACTRGMETPIARLCPFVWLLFHIYGGVSLRW